MDGVNKFFKIPYYNENDNDFVNVNFIMNVRNNEIKIFKSTNNNPILEDVVIYDINDLNNYAYIKFDLSNKQKMFFNMFLKLPFKLTYICFSESFAIDESNNIICFVLNKENNRYDLKIIKPIIIDQDVYELDTKYKKVIDLLYNNQDVQVEGIMIFSDFFKKCIEDSTIIETLNSNDKLKTIYIKLLTIYQKYYNSNLDDNNKIIRNNNGFVNNLFMVSLSGFMLAIIVVIIILIVKKNMF